ncbi:MAG: hypothetical protein JXR94_01765, partial [Candidatus Hydrogenedentes bacterium]|nr:hypothetical protein [Candidatus Hydrogenedentota bacterium]
GFASTCITPPPGRDIPGLFNRRLALGVYDDLFARAAVVDDGQRCVAMVQTDAIKVSEDLVAEARKQAHALCGIAKQDCFIAATHTHSGGPVFGGFMAQPDPHYPPFVAQQIASAIAEAHRTRVPALIGTGACPAEGIAFNRRFIMKDGRQTTHPGKMNPDIFEPAGPADPTVTVVAFGEPATCRPLGCIVNFGCHATHMNGLLYSADYPRWIVDTLQRVYGPDFGVVFLNGACGDVTQVDNQSPRPGEFGPYWCERTGRTIGGAALQAVARMDYYKDASVAAGSARVRAAIRKASPSTLKAARALLREREITPKDVETVYANEALLVEGARRKAPVRTLEIQGVRLADAWFWGVPGEFFQAFALSVREDSLFAHTCCVELANGYNGYICTAEAFGGGYESRTARSSLLVPEAGGAIVRAARRLRNRMFADAEGELAGLPGRRTWPGVDDNALDGIKQLKKRGTARRTKRRAK